MKPEEMTDEQLWAALPPAADAWIAAKRWRDLLIVEARSRASMPNEEIGKAVGMTWRSVYRIEA